MVNNIPTARSNGTFLKELPLYTVLASFLDSSIYKVDLVGQPLLQRCAQWIAGMP